MPATAYPITGHNFVVLFGNSKLGFSKVSEIHVKSAELTSINEGGRNKPYIVHDTKKSFNTITFEKGYGMPGDIEKLNSISPLAIVIKDSKQKMQAAYWTNRAVLQDLVLSDLNGGQAELLIQKMTFAYNTFKKFQSEKP